MQTSGPVPTHMQTSGPAAHARADQRTSHHRVCRPMAPPQSHAPPEASFQAPGVCALLTSYTPATFRIARISDGNRAASGSWTV